MKVDRDRDQRDAPEQPATKVAKLNKKLTLKKPPVEDYTPPHTPFQSAEDAWFWYCLMQSERDAGFKPNGSGSQRPCDIDDIALIVNRLWSHHRITAGHIKALGKYGKLQSIPDKRVDPYGLKLWEDALDRMHTHLVVKGIVEVPKRNKFTDAKPEDENNP